MDPRICPLNWDTYVETFPERYLRRGHFDDVMGQRLDKMRQVLRVLEIGGGTTGCPLFQPEPPSNLRVWFLDPLVTKVPDWVVENLGWDQAVKGSLKFDLVVARGCINYLTPWEIRAIPDMLVPGGLFLANTFGQVREGSRMSAGRKGLLQESIRWEHPNIVHHELTLPDGCVINHSFFHYTQNQYLVFLGGPEGGCLFTSYGDNSLLIELRG